MRFLFYYGHYFLQKKEWLGGFTGIWCSNSSCSCKVTRPLSLALLLEIAVNCIVTVSSNSVGLETRAILVQRITISSSSTSIVQGLLQYGITSILANAPSGTYHVPHKNFKPKKKLQVHTHNQESMWSIIWNTLCICIDMLCA